MTDNYRPHPGRDLHLTFGPSLTTGIHEIDRQHARLVELFNVLIDSHTDPPALRAAGAELHAFVVHHFDTESQLMRQADYPDTQVHQGEHGALIELLDHKLRDLAAEPDRIAATAQLFYRWLLNHTGSSDRALAEHISDRRSTTQAATRSFHRREEGGG